MGIGFSFAFNNDFQSILIDNIVFKSRKLCCNAAATFTKYYSNFSLIVYLMRYLFHATVKPPNNGTSIKRRTPVNGHFLPPVTVSLPNYSYIIFVNKRNFHLQLTENRSILPDFFPLKMI